MNEFEMFGTPDLFDEKNVRQVVSSIHALGRTVQAKLPDWGRPHLGIKVVEKNVRVWTEEQLRAASVSVSLLNLGSSDHGKKAAEAVLDGTGELDESGKADKLKKAVSGKLVFPASCLCPLTGVRPCDHRSNTNSRCFATQL